MNGEHHAGEEYHASEEDYDNEEGQAGKKNSTSEEFLLVGSTIR